MPASPPLGILHLGLGSFHRAHQAAYLQRLIEAGDDRWTLTSGNICPDTGSLIDVLEAQRGGYTLETVSPDGDRRYQWIDAIRNVVRWEPTLAGLVATGADPATCIVSFTVTEAGYYLDAAGRLDPTAAEIASDLAAAAHARPGRTLYGALAAILRERQRRGAGGVTLLSCDNLRHNGERARAALLAFIEMSGDAGLLAWAQSHTSCPNTMVDRITPRPTPDVVQRVKAATGRDDPAALMAESFSQWVIEESFIAGRPAWEQVGVEMVATVVPYEEAKIRLLNATHSCIAWAGTLKGYSYIDEGVRDPAVRRLAHDYATLDAIPALSPSPLDLAAYRDAVLARFGNPAIRDTNERVAMDGYSKIAGFIAPTIRDRLAQDAGIEAVAVLPALFLACLQRWHLGRLPYPFHDQALTPAAAHRLCADEDPIARLASDTALWGTSASDPRLVGALRRAAERVTRFVQAADAVRPESPPAQRRPRA